MMLLTPMAVAAISVQAFTIKGMVLDNTTKEPLIGATIQIEGTTIGAITDIGGKFELKHVHGKSCNLIVQYVSYQSQKISVTSGQKEELVITLVPDNRQLDEVTVVAKKNLEGERALLIERQRSSVAIESIGSKEMNTKGISNVEEGVKKITGISLHRRDRLSSVDLATVTARLH